MGRFLPTQFVIFCEARTGSYSLVSRLHACQDIICHGEIFKEQYIELSPYHRERMAHYSIESRNSDPVSFISELRGINKHRIFGFKLFNSHLKWAPKAFDYVSAPETRRVVLDRDPVEMYASLLRAQATGGWLVPKDAPAGATANVVAGDAAAAQLKVRYAAESLRPFAHYVRAFRRRCRALSKLGGTFVLRYEQLNDREAMAALLDFLGSRAAPEDAESSYRKQYEGRLEESFENWEELRDALEAEWPFGADLAPTVGLGAQRSLRPTAGAMD